jgi:hypothetical protein
MDWSFSREVLFDEIDVMLMQNRRAFVGLGPDDFFYRSVWVKDLIRPSQRLGIYTPEDWSQFEDASTSGRRPRNLNVNQEVGMKCNFCFNNKEPSEVWSTHNLKEEGKIACQILRNYVCPKCGATGDKAHTNRYCPLNRPGEAVTSIKDLNKGRTSAGRYSMNACKKS